MRNHLIRILQSNRVFKLKHLFKTERCMRKSSKMSSAQYGSWKSPISSKLVSENSVIFDGVHVDAKDNVYWSELRFDEGGRYVVCSYKPGTKGFTAWTPEGFNSRTRVHEYGGGAFFVHNGQVFFSNFQDQDMYLQESHDASPKRVTAEGTHWRYADGHYSEKHRRIYCVREDHSKVEKGEAKEAQNTVVTINPEDGNQVVLAEGCDFYSSPRVSPDGKKIAWVQWNHPNMPWDSTALMEANLSEDGANIIKGSEKQVAGGTDISVIQPSWTCDNELLYIDDRTDWWNLYHVTKSGDHVNVLPRSQECGGPQWQFGMNAYMVDPRGNGDVVVAYGKELGVYNLDTKSYKSIDTGFTSHSCINIGSNGMIYCISGSPTKFSCVVQIDFKTGNVDILRESKSLDMDAGYFSIPEEIQWKTSEGDTSYGYFYPPANKDFSAPEGTQPPLLVKNHGGPTARSSNILNLKIQYFTSRGMAVLDVNYRGSTGYGKKYRHKLRNNWGVYDLEDACSGAKHLADTGKVDGSKLCIDGGSAGGYTTLAALTFRDTFKADGGSAGGYTTVASLTFKDTFKAGASHYGVGDLEALAKDTHKFESRYLDTMIAPYDEEHKKIYHDRSPIHYIEQLSCALALFQGDEDQIVPQNQADTMYEAVKEKGLPTMYVLFKGEQHGFRKAENIQTALDGEFYFFSKVFGYESADKHISIPIDNLD